MFICLVQICYNNFDNKYSRVFLLSIHQSVMCLVGFWLMTESYKKSEVKTQKWIYVGHISRHMSDNPFLGFHFRSIKRPHHQRTCSGLKRPQQLTLSIRHPFVSPSKCLPFIGALVIVYTQT